MSLQTTIIKMLNILEQKKGKIKGRENLEKVISRIPDISYNSDMLWDSAEYTAKKYGEVIIRSSHDDLDGHLEAIIDELIELAKKLHPGVIPSMEFVTFTGTMFLSFIQNLHTKEVFSLVINEKFSMLVKHPDGPKLN